MPIFNKKVKKTVSNCIEVHIVSSPVYRGMYRVAGLLMIPSPKLKCVHGPGSVHEASGACTRPQERARGLKQSQES